MSEALPGMPPPPLAKPPRDAAAVVLFRRTAKGPEVFWLKREAKLQFAGGFYAFPGGKVDAADRDVPVDGASDLEATLRVSAARELFEETGVLMAQGARGIAQGDLDALRRGVLDGSVAFGTMLRDRGLTLLASDFAEAGRWVTPPYMPARFDARFFLVEAPAWAKAQVWPGELTEGEWIAPAAALARWEAGTALLHPPNLHAVRTIGALTAVDAALEQLNHPPHCEDFIAERLEFQRGIRLYPLRSLTLPPATHTNCYLLGTRSLMVVDPGAADDSEMARLIRHLRELVAEGHTIQGVLLTHHHEDHTAGLSRLVAELNVPVYAHPLTANRLAVKAQQLLNEGDALELPGEPSMTFRVLHTPGHAKGHLCLLHEASRALIAGDMVSGVSTIVIDPPEGDMAEYLAQLKRLKELGVHTIYPAHGPPSPDGPAKLDEYLRHRAWREEKVLGAIAAEGCTVEELVPRAYDDVAAFVLPIAERNVVAILDKLQREGRVRRQGERFFAR